MIDILAASTETGTATTEATTTTTATTKATTTRTGSSERDKAIAKYDRFAHSSSSVSITGS